MSKWKLKKQEVKEALVSHMFGAPDDNPEWYDLHINKDGSVEVQLNSKGWYHSNRTATDNAG